MVLLIGSVALAIGIVFLLNIFIFKHLPKFINYLITFIIGLSAIATRTVHGIWLGLCILVLGLSWLKLFYKPKTKTQA